MGVILYEMCMLKCPFDASNLHGLVLKIIRGVYPPISANFSPSLKSLVSLLLTKAPSARPNINQVLKHQGLGFRV
jgi:NIMA (never in mitosis gene a)-related kinase